MYLAVCILLLQVHHRSKNKKDIILRNIKEKRMKKEEILAKKIYRISSIIQSTYDKVVFLVHLIIQGSNKTDNNCRETNNLF